MSKTKLFFLPFIMFFFIFSAPIWGEKISLKVSYKTSSISGGDLNDWINAYNSQWKDWQSALNGELTGQYNTLTYGPKYEVELRIPLYWGISLNVAASHFSRSEEGNITLLSGIKNQSETGFLRNKIRAYPLKVGFSYSYALPYLDNLYVLAGIGRHITFIRYETTETHNLEISSYGRTFSYNLSKENSYNSESLGFYADFGVEYDLVKYIAIVIEAEKVWSKADGFKGSFTRELTTRIPPDEITETESGEASLYYYESKPYWSDKYYVVFNGHEKRPEGEEIRNIRQGEFDLGSFSFKIGVRFKF